MRASTGEQDEVFEDAADYLNQESDNPQRKGELMETSTEKFLEKTGASDAPPVVTEDRLAEVVERAQGKKRGRKPKQEAFEEMKQPEIPEVSAAAELYAGIRDDRIAKTREEVEAREQLITLMHQHNLTTYTVGNLTATLESKEKVKVKIADDDDELEVY